MEQLLDKTYFGNTLYAYLVAIAVFCGLCAILPMAKRIGIKNLQRLVAKTRFDFDDFLADLLKLHITPTVYFFIALYFGARSLTLPDGVNQILRILFVIVVTFKLVQVIEALAIFLFSKWTIKTEEESPTRAAMVKNMTSVVRVALWAAGILFVLDNLGINVTAFVTGLGIGGVAVALAAQAVLGDAFSSFAIFFDRPFEVGDFIIVGDLLGTVEHVGFKTTRIRSLGGEQLIFANSDLTGSRIRNYKRMEQRRVVFKLGVIYQTTLEQLKAIPEIIRSVIEEHDLTRFDRAHFQSYGDFALIFEVVYYVLSPDYNKYMDVQQYINVRIFEEFKKADIEFAYPTQQLYVTKVEPPA